MVQMIGVAEARNRFSELVNRAAFDGERYVVERRGKPLAALISSDEYHQLVGLLTEKGLRDDVHGMPVQLRLEGDHYVVSSDELDLYGVGHTPQEARDDYLLAAREAYADLTAHAGQMANHLEVQLARLRRVLSDTGSEP